MEDICTADKEVSSQRGTQQINVYCNRDSYRLLKAQELATPKKSVSTIHNNTQFTSYKNSRILSQSAKEL